MSLPMALGHVDLQMNLSKVELFYRSCMERTFYQLKIIYIYIQKVQIKEYISSTLFHSPCYEGDGKKHEI